MVAYSYVSLSLLRKEKRKSESNLSLSLSCNGEKILSCINSIPSPPSPLMSPLLCFCCHFSCETKVLSCNVFFFLSHAAETNSVTPFLFFFFLLPCSLFFPLLLLLPPLASVSLPLCLSTVAAHLLLSSSSCNVAAIALREGIISRLSHSHFFIAFSLV